MSEFDAALLRLKERLSIASDKAVAELLGMSDKALNARKRRGVFPEDKLYALATKRPELNLDVLYVLTGQNELGDVEETRHMIREALVREPEGQGPFHELLRSTLSEKASSLKRRRERVKAVTNRLASCSDADLLLVEILLARLFGSSSIEGGQR